MTKLEQMLFDSIHSGYYRRTITISCTARTEYVAYLTDCNGGRIIASAIGDTISEAIEALQELLAEKEKPR